MKWVDPPRSMDDLWAAAEGACRFRGIYWGFMGVMVHSGAGWQAMAMGADRLGDHSHYITGHARTPRLALGVFLVNMLETPKFDARGYFDPS